MYQYLQFPRYAQQFAQQQMMFGRDASRVQIDPRGAAAVSQLPQHVLDQGLLQQPDLRPTSHINNPARGSMLAMGPAEYGHTEIRLSSPSSVNPGG